MFDSDSEADFDDPKTVVHQGHEHPLVIVYGYDELSSPSQTCHRCGFVLLRTDYKCFKCQEVGCEYYLDTGCAVYDSQIIHHPLHPQHSLTINYNNEKNQFVCSFCGETKKSGFFYHCNHGQCDFYLDVYCSNHFTNNKDLLEKYEFQHFLHDHDENHRLSPYIRSYSGTRKPCSGCGLHTFERLIFKCTSCSFYLHVPCSQVPKEVHHNFHPQHPLTLLSSPPVEFKDEPCFACLMTIRNAFVLHCTNCHINLHLRCAFLKPTVKCDHHEHLLVPFKDIYVNYVRCSACNVVSSSLEGKNILRCVECNFSIHSECLSLPAIITYDDHVHPLTLTSSFREDDSGLYYCDICEERRNPDHGLYTCQECSSFVAHFKCVLPMWEAPSCLKKEVEHFKTEIERERDSSTTEEEEDMPLTEDELVSTEYTFFLQCDAEIAKLGKVVKQLIIKKRLGKKQTGKLEELNQSRKNAEGLLRRLEQSFKETG